MDKTIGISVMLFKVPLCKGWKGQLKAEQFGEWLPTSSQIRAIDEALR